jgi:DNA-binding NtrC family response regulator
MATATATALRLEDRVPVDVLVVSPNPKLRDELMEKLCLPRWRVGEANGGAEALMRLREHGGNDAVLLLDPVLPDLDTGEFHRIVRDRFPSTQILMLNSHTGQLLVGAASPTAISRKVVDAVNRVASIRAEALQSSDQENREPENVGVVRLRSMVGNSQPMLRIYSLARMVATHDATVLITGESGTGKDLIAQEIHLISGRRNQPFVVVNCSAIPETLLEAELFGYTKGSFTGAVQSRIGRIHAAHGGTLFLDEIGDMPLPLQSKILRFLEQGEVQRIGGNDNLKVDVRVIAATNSELKARVAQKQFREDLYYRLAVFPIHLPPLRERMGDIKDLTLAFASKYHPRASVTQEALQVLQQHNWPGNVRELRNTIERASVLVGNGLEIKPDHIIL